MDELYEKIKLSLTNNGFGSKGKLKKSDGTISEEMSLDAAASIIYDELVLQLKSSYNNKTINLINTEAADKELKDKFSLSELAKFTGKYIVAPAAAITAGSFAAPYVWPYLKEPLTVGLDLYGGYEGATNFSKDFNTMTRRWNSGDKEGAIYSGIGTALDAAGIAFGLGGTNKLFRTGVLFGDNSYKLGLGVLGSSNGYTNVGVPVPRLTRISKEALEYNKTRELPYYEVTEDKAWKALPDASQRAFFDTPLKRPLHAYGRRLISERTYTGADDYYDLLNMISDHRGYGLDFSGYDKTSYVFDGTVKGAFERNRVGEKQLSMLPVLSSLPDFAYSLGHVMWKDIANKLTDEDKTLLRKLIKGFVDYDKEERMYTIVKDLLARILNSFINDNKYSFKNIDEYIDYVENIPDEILIGVVKSLHGGKWADKIDLSEKGIELLRLALMYNNGGKLCKKSLNYSRKH